MLATNKWIPLQLFPTCFAKTSRAAVSQKSLTLSIKLNVLTSQTLQHNTHSKFLDISQFLLLPLLELGCVYVAYTDSNWKTIVSLRNFFEPHPEKNIFLFSNDINWIELWLKKSPRRMYFLLSWAGIYLTKIIEAKGFILEDMNSIKNINSLVIYLLCG